MSIDNIPKALLDSGRKITRPRNSVLEEVVNKNRAILTAACVLGVAVISTVWLSKNSKHAGSTDAALLALIKNDVNGFEAFIKAGGNVHDKLPEIDGAVYTVAQGIAHFERTEFAKLLNSKKTPYVQQDANASHDIMTIAVKKNNSDLFGQIAKENPAYKMAYGKNGWTLLHMASAWCSHKLVSILHEKGDINWNEKAKDGSTPLTLAAQNDCLPMLSYWKLQKADFKSKDGRGLTALGILKGKKDPALLAFADSFMDRRTAAAGAGAGVPNFYKKRVIPKDQIVDHSAMLEPEDRPLEATETAEHSEFAD